MAIQRVEDLQKGLDKDLAWRKKELSGLRLAAQRSDDDRFYLFRAGLVLLCAHWEGFLKRGVTLYLQHVFAQGLMLKQLSPAMVAVCYFDDVKNAARADYPGSEQHHIRLASRILNSSGEVCTQVNWSVKMEGNPSTQLLDRILLSIDVDSRLGMDVATWASMRVFIDEQILRDRHQIAHGEGFRLTKQDFLERVQRLIVLLESLHSSIVLAAENARYRAA